MFHFHKWKEYKDIAVHGFGYYRICTICGVVDQWLGPECGYVRQYNVCRTNSWKPIEIAALLEDEENS